MELNEQANEIIDRFEKEFHLSYSKNEREDLVEFLNGMMKEYPMPNDDDGAARIGDERSRQKKVEGWSSSHDDEQDSCQLSMAASCYLRHAVGQVNGVCFAEDEDEFPLEWPWFAEWWKPSEDPIRNLVKAGALIAAEIDRLKRIQGEKGDTE